MSSSSEDRHRRKRDRSRTRKDVKGRRKRARRRSFSCDSSEDSVRAARKRKKVKRKNKHDDEMREKPYKKKKIRREASVSSMSSGSRSCSTCQGGSASNDDSRYESSRGRLERKEKDKRRLRGRSASEKSARLRARSCSPCSSPRNESIYEGTEEKYMCENKSRRLRSVITFTKEGEESRELCGNETKEEIVDDHDYPCRSNDSNDGGTKRELDHHTDPASEEKLGVEDETGDMDADVNFTEPNLRDRSYNDMGSLEAYSTGTSESMKKETGDTSGANLNGDDLESILRQRALENLRKFRGEVQSTAKASEQKSKIISQVKQPITDKEESVQGKSNVSNAAVGTKFDKQTPVEEASLSVWRRNSVAHPRNNERILNMDKDISGSAKNQLACAPEKVIDADNPGETVTESTNNKKGNLELTTSESCLDSLQSCSSLKQTTVSGLPQQKLVVAESTKDKVSSEAARVMSHSSNVNVNDTTGMPSAIPKPSIHGPKFKHSNLNKGQDGVNDHSQLESKQTSDSRDPSTERNAAKTTQAAIQSINSSGRDVDELRNAAIGSSVDNSSGKSQDESNQGSQFEQKTMTVMRGGELVQVSV